MRIWALGPGEAEPRAKAGEAPKSGRARGFEFARKALAGGASLLILSGPLDHEALNRLQPAVDDLGRRGPLKLILDLAAVPWLPSVGIAWLVATESRAREKGGRLIIIRAPAKVRYVLDRMMLGDLLTFAPDLEAAGRLFEGGSATAAQAADR